MSAKGTADIVFCLDASSSMQPCFDAMRAHVGDFVSSLQANANMKWDWRIDFIAHHASEGDSAAEAIFSQTSLRHEEAVFPLYQDRRQSGSFFTSDLEEFKRELAGIEVFGDESPLIALDCCLDFPCRPAATCHRVVILMTDEPAEDGVRVREQTDAVPDLIKKIQQLKVLLFIIAPDSKIFDELSQVNKSEYEVVDSMGDGLSQVDFRKLLTAIGKSVSVSTLQSVKDVSVERGLFGQASWDSSEAEFRGA